MQNHISDEDRRRLDEANRELHQKQQQTEQQHKRRDHTRDIQAMVAEMRRRGLPLGSGFQGLHWQTHNGYRLLMQGLLREMGERTQWLEEYDEVADWLDDNHGLGLMLIGDCGRGKSVITSRVVPWLVSQQVITTDDGMRMSVPEVFTARDLRNRKADMLRQRIIIVDDVGTEPIAKVYGETHNYFDELVSEAYDLRKTLIISTNLRIEDLFGDTDDDPASPTYGQRIDGRYDQRTKSRLREMTRQVYLEGPDLRDERNIIHYHSEQ